MQRYFANQAQNQKLPLANHDLAVAWMNYRPQQATSGVRVFAQWGRDLRVLRPVVLAMYKFTKFTNCCKYLYT
jgi:hypothetical protein